MEKDFKQKAMANVERIFQRNFQWRGRKEGSKLGSLRKMAHGLMRECIFFVYTKRCSDSTHEERSIHILSPFERSWGGSTHRETSRARRESMAKREGEEGRMRDAAATVHFSNDAMFFFFPSRSGYTFIFVAKACSEGTFPCFFLSLSRSRFDFGILRERNMFRDENEDWILNKDAQRFGFFWQ